MAELAGTASGGTWDDMFAHWVPERLHEAEAAATLAMHREADRLATAARCIYQREAEQLQAWLQCRADELCGPFVPRTADLFSNALLGPDWPQRTAPLDRLTGFAAEPDTPPARRREAGSVVALYRRRSEDLTARASLAPPVLSMLGTLMLVP